MRTLQGAVVVITGATAGVGRATARAFARRGAKVALLARGQAGLEATRKDVENLGGHALALSVDVADAEGVERAAAEVEAALGPIDVWVGNAMATVYGELQAVTPEEFRRVTEVTYHGQVYGAMSALRRMLPRDRGTIVFVGSALAYRGIPLQSAYCGAKHALQGLLDSLRAELFHRGANVSAVMVQLPALNTPQFEWARTKMTRKPRPAAVPFQPEVAAEAIVFAATDGRHRREVYVGASTAAIIAADKLAPGLADRYLGRTGYEAAMREEPVEPGRQDNLFSPVDRDFGAHGAFDREAYAHSPQLWATKRRPWLAAGLLGLLAGAALSSRR